MNNKQLQNLHDEISEKIDNGEFEKALRMMEDIEQNKLTLGISYMLSGLYIDLGAILLRENLIRKGLDLLLENINELKRYENLEQSVYYNIANGYSEMSKFLIRKDSQYGYMVKDTLINEAINYYNMALNCKEKNNHITTQVLVNLANAYELLGRNIEALELYDNAIKISPEFGLALGNKGIALKYYARLTGGNWSMHYKIAHDLMLKAINNGVYKEAEHIFLKQIADIEKHINTNINSECKMDYNNVNLNFKTDFEKFYIEFNIKNRLYLNLCNQCQKCNYALGDDIHISKMIEDVGTSLEDSPFLKLSSFLNEIKQNYITARFLLIQSQFRDKNLTFVDNNVKIINTLNYAQHNVYIQLLKFSYKNMFDILDKIAILLNEYLKLGKDERRIDFNNIWYKEGDRSRSKLNSKIYALKDLNLNALFNIYLDLESSKNRKGRLFYLSNIRNAVTHRFLEVYSEFSCSDERINENYLVEKTIEISKIVRNSIIYLLSFIDSRESEKERQIGNKIGKIMYDSIPDDLKHIF